MRESRNLRLEPSHPLFTTTNQTVPTRMQTTILNQSFEDKRAAHRPTRLWTRIHVADSCERRRNIRINFAPRRESCLTKRTMLAAMREAELAEWMATGGDYLASMHKPID
jgi:hypothetical protein